MDSTDKGIILYIDDEENNLLTFKSSFRRLYEVHTAISALEALEILEKEPIQLIITDQRMPDMTGTEFLAKIIPKFPDLIRMILTGFSEIGSIIEAINKGQVYRFILKPWDREELKMTIDNALEAFHLRQKNKELLSNLQKYNEELEQKVTDRTLIISQKNGELEHKNKQIMASINYAKRIQNAILPFEEKFVRAFGKDNFFVLFKPKDIVSGDFYWFEEIHRSDPAGLTETLNFLAVADCTGHGVSGAFMSMIANQILHETIVKNQIYAPNLVLKHLHKEVLRVLRQKETNTNDGLDICLIVISKNSDGFMNKIEYSGAMNPLFYVQNNELIEIKATKKAIGGHQSEDERLFEMHEISLQSLEDRGEGISNSFPLSSKPSPLTTIYLCTDGYQDQFGGLENRKFMVKNLKNLLLEISEQAMSEQKQILENRLNDWILAGKEEQIDDITIFGIKV